VYIAFELCVVADEPVEGTDRIYPRATCQQIVDRMKSGVPITVEARSRTDDIGNPVSLEKTMGVVDQKSVVLTEDGRVEFDIIWAIANPENDSVKVAAEKGKLLFTPLGKGKLFENNVID